MTEENLQAALKKFEELVREQSARSDKIKPEKEFLDYEKLDKIIIGVYPDDVALVNASEEVQRAEARKFAEKFCNPDKPCVINFNSSKVLPVAYREELYKQSRILFAK